MALLKLLLTYTALATLLLGASEGAPRQAWPGRWRDVSVATKWRLRNLVLLALPAEPVADPEAWRALYANQEANDQNALSSANKRHESEALNPGALSNGENLVLEMGFTRRPSLLDSSRSDNKREETYLQESSVTGVNASESSRDSSMPETSSSGIRCHGNREAISRPCDPASGSHGYDDLGSRGPDSNCKHLPDVNCSTLAIGQCYAPEKILPDP